MAEASDPILEPATWEDKTPDIMELIFGRKLRKQIHSTTLDVFAICGVRGEFQYVKGIPRQNSAHISIGKTTHKTVDYDLKTKIADGELATDSNVKEFAAATFEDEIAKFPPVLDDDDIEEGLTLGSAKDKSVALSFMHHRELAPYLRPATVGRNFSLKLDAYLLEKGREYHAAAEDATNRNARKVLDAMGRAHIASSRQGFSLVGEQDIQELYPTPFGDQSRYYDRLVIRDSKTSKKSPNKDAAENSDQLGVYALASKILDGRLPDEMALDYLVQTPKTQKRYVKTISIEPLEENVQVTLARLSAVIFALHSGVFMPAKSDDWHCSKKFCPYWDICPYARRPTSSKPSNLITIGEPDATPPGEAA